MILVTGEGRAAKVAAAVTTGIFWRTQTSSDRRAVGYGTDAVPQRSMFPGVGL
jgi:hypothetical protein